MYQRHSTETTSLYEKVIAFSEKKALKFLLKISQIHKNIPIRISSQWKQKGKRYILIISNKIMSSVPS